MPAESDHSGILGAFKQGAILSDRALKALRDRLDGQHDRMLGHQMSFEQACKSLQNAASCYSVKLYNRREARSTYVTSKSQYQKKAGETMGTAQKQVDDGPSL